MRTVQTLFQNLINSLETGAGALLIRIFLLAVLVSAVLGGYAWARFGGLTNCAAMENAQLARNIAGGKGYVTKCIRPADAWYLREHSGKHPDPSSFPDIRHAPGFPFLVSLGFRLVKPDFAVRSDGSVFDPEKTVIVPLCLLFTVLTGWLIFLTGKCLFDPRVGFIAMLAYFLTEPVLENGVSGTQHALMALITTAGFYAAAVSVRNKSAESKFPAWAGLFLVSAFLCGASILASYALVVLAPGMAFVLGACRERKQVFAACLFLVVVAMTVSPWLYRNHRVSGGIFGIAPYSVLENSNAYPDDSLSQTPEPVVDNARAARALKTKFVSNLSTARLGRLASVAGGILFCFFIVSLFHRSGDDETELLKRGLLISMLLMLAVFALVGGESRMLFGVFIPLVAVYATAFFLAMLERLEIVEQGRENLVIWIFLLLVAAPTAASVASGVRKSPYPPYHPPFIGYVCGLMQDDELVCSDIPCATAWYGDRISVLLPRSVGDFRTLTDRGMNIKGLYLAGGSAGKYCLRRQSGKISGASWASFLDKKAVPDGFPLVHGIEFPEGTGDQVFLTDMPRWEKQE